MAGDGLAGFGELLMQVPQGSLKANVIRAHEDGDYVFTHTEYNFFGPKVGFDIFRINGPFDKMGSYFDGDNYIQHNTAVPDNDQSNALYRIRRRPYSSRWIILSA
jgi:predicted SnoaL-like aldol condensation-catalyzing enzyme